MTSGAKTDFDANRLSVTKTAAREWETVAADDFTGTLYAFWPYDMAAWSTPPSLTAIYTPAGDTQPQQIAQTLRSRTSGVDNVLASGAQGNTVIYRASVQGQDMTQYQDYTLRIRRAPTLKELRVTEKNGSPAALEQYDARTRTYTWLVVSQQVTLALTPSVKDGCRLYVDGADVTAAGGCTVSVGETETSVKLELKAGGETTQYTLLLRPTESCLVRIPVASADIGVTVCDQNGQAVTGSFVENLKEYRFTLIPGKSYTYTATQNTYYHAQSSFVAETKRLPAVSVQTGEWLTELALSGDNGSGSKGNLALDQSFDPSVHAYTATVPDTPSAVYLWIDGDIQTAQTTFSVQYRTITSTSQDDRQINTAIPSSQLDRPVFLQDLLLNRNGRGNTLTVRCQRSAAGSTVYYQDYTVTLRRTFSLRSLSLVCGGQEQTLMHSGGAAGYSPSVWTYTATVPAAATELSVCADVYSTDGCYRDNGEPGYRVWLNGRELKPGEAVSVTLNGTAEPETLTLTLKNEFAGEEEKSEYQIQLRKAQPILFTPEPQPADALLFVRETLSGQRIWPDGNGAYALSDGFTYQYLLTSPGYRGCAGTIRTAHSESGALELLLDARSVSVTDGAAHAKLTLTEARKNETLLNLPAEWADFRGTSYRADGTMGGSAGSNNTVLSVKTPVDANASTLYWARKLGDSFDSSATGCPLLVDGVLITYSGDTLYRVDLISGEILAQAQMERASSYAITPPAYAKGMVFVGLSDGTLQAFDARTLQSLWVYHDALGGQPNCPITVCGDYLYTGFWIGEEFPANFVCLSITDEDPSQTDEEKTACWYRTTMGGYYKNLVGVASGLGAAHIERMTIPLIKNAQGEGLFTLQELKSIA